VTEQGAAEQALGVAQRADGHVGPRAGGGEGGQVGGDHHGGDVLGVDAGVSDVDPQPLEHGFQALAGEGRVAERVAGAVQADHEAVADQLVVAHALDRDDVLDPRRRLRGGGAERSEQGGGDEREAAHGSVPCESRANPEPLRMQGLGWLTGSARQVLPGA
jgi:hypothetical protein